MTGEISNELSGQRRLGLMIVRMRALEDNRYTDIPKLPPGSYARSLHYDYNWGGVVVTFQNPLLPDVPEWEIIPRFAPMVLIEDGIVKEIFWPEDWVTSCKV